MSDSTNERDERTTSAATAHARWDELVAAYASDELDAAERRDLERHLAGCAECRATLADVCHIGALLRTLAPQPAGGALTAPALADAVLARLAAPTTLNAADTACLDAAGSPDVIPFADVRPVSPLASVLEPESLQWRFQSVSRRPRHPALTWRSGVRGLERWGLGMEHDTRADGEDGATATSISAGEDIPDQDAPTLRPFGQQPGPRSGRVLVTVAAVLLVAVLASILFANRPHGASGGPAAKATATIAPTGGLDDYLASMDMVSPTEGWAVGWLRTNGITPRGTLIWHYVDGQWARVLSDPNGPALSAISMDSPSDGWAVGTGGTLLHYHDGVWTSTTIPTGNDLAAIDMLSATDGWAVGDTGANGKVILRYHDGAWTPEAIHTNGLLISSLSDISMISASEGWAIGIERAQTSGANDTSFILHYAGGVWTLQATVAGTDLSSLSMDSPTDGWAVGSSSSAMLLMHYTGGRWIRVSAPSDVGDGQLSDVSMVSADEGWAVGGTNGGSIYDIGGAFTVTNVLLLHYNRGHWTSVIPPNVPGTEQETIMSIAMVSADEGWAAGEVITKRSGVQGVAIVPLLFHYLNGVWTVAS